MRSKKISIVRAIFYWIVQVNEGPCLTGAPALNILAIPWFSLGLVLALLCLL